jgi:hypothetical protein
VRAALLIASILLIGSCGRSEVRALSGRSTVKDGGTDGGIRKDGGVKPDPDAGVEECILPPDAFNIAAIRFDMDMRRSDAAEVISVSPLNLRFFDGALFTFGYTRSSLFHRIGPGDVVFADVEVETPFWTNTFVAISELGDNGPGDPIAAGWTIADGSRIQLLEPAVRYFDADCSPSGGDDTCGTIVTRMLEVTIEGDQVVVAPGEENKIGDYVLGNGSSYRFEGMPRCTDTPLGWRAGFIERE